jgi:L-alanine-DL-glutamate epimerase-like enolase superfamily enzyme
MADAYTITKIDLWPVDIPLTDPFVVATGQRSTAQNLFVRLTLKGGSQGYGEMAPFPEVGGRDRATCLAAATSMASTLIGQPAVQYRGLARHLYEVGADQAAARCGLETALLDAVTRELGIPLWAFWGGGDVRERESDITIPISSVSHAVTLSRRWYSHGFRLFKMKVGSTVDPDVDSDVRRVEALHSALGNVAFIADANQGYTREQCLAFVKETQRLGADIVLLEQPVAWDDLDSLAAIRRDTGVPVAADESVRSLQDLRDVVRREAADFVNIKIMKSGLLQAMDIMAYTRAAGLRLMIGGMVESRVAMGCSFALVLGMGGYELLDLDTPLLMANDPVEGGYRYDGARLQPWSGPGLDLLVRPPATITTVE